MHFQKHHANFFLHEEKSGQLEKFPPDALCSIKHSTVGLYQNLFTQFPWGDKGG
jgi:hypothetical protein